jgi:hypothetical protein
MKLFTLFWSASAQYLALSDVFEQPTPRQIADLSVKYLSDILLALLLAIVACFYMWYIHY